jgi:2,3-dihydroxyphenylpropionate 1,2-dioxygenase
MSTTTIVGGAMLPHAPQFFTLPDSEDKATVQAVREVATRIAHGLKAQKPDLWIMIANDHAQQFFHQCAPPFTLHVGGRATGQFAGREFSHAVPSEISFELVRQLYRAGFDPAFTSTAEIDYALGIPLAHLGIAPDVPVLPIYVNAYLPPQPTMERCYAFDRLREGKLKSLIGYDEKELDETGNIELRCWAVAAGALGERVPDVCQMNPSWHHNYASLGWYSPMPEDGDPHYPQLKPELVQLITALHALAHEPQARTDYLDDAAAYADRFALTPAQRTALVNLDMPAIAAMGAHPLAPFLANMQIERLRKAAK